MPVEIICLTALSEMYHITTYDWRNTSLVSNNTETYNNDNVLYCRTSLERNSSSEKLIHFWYCPECNELSKHLQCVFSQLRVYFEVCICY